MFAPPYTRVKCAWRRLLTDDDIGQAEHHEFERDERRHRATRPDRSPITGGTSCSSDRRAVPSPPLPEEPGDSAHEAGEQWELESGLVPTDAAAASAHLHPDVGITGEHQQRQGDDGCEHRCHEADAETLDQAHSLNHADAGGCDRRDRVST